ncbi:MAG: hypothetical protein QM736_09205 [Vicinamibacterales bacterium]
MPADRVNSFGEKYAADKTILFQTQQKFLEISYTAKSLFEPTPKFLLKTNYILNLNNSLSEISTGYSENTKRNIAKAEKRKLQFISGKLAIQSFSDFVSSHTQNSGKTIEILANVLKEHEHLLICAVCSENQELQAADLCIKTHNRIIHLVPVTTADGRKNGAMHFLIHNLIYQFQQQNYLLDFEGSSIPSIARFYRSFGATEEYFFEKKRLVR